MYMYIYIYICMYLYIYVCLCVCVDLRTSHFHKILVTSQKFVNKISLNFFFFFVI